MKRIEWTDSAIADLEDIRVYLHSFGPELVDRSMSALVLATRWLLEHPGAGPLIGYRSWRKWKPRGERHLPIYEKTSFGISVVRVRHERNDWRPLPE